MDEWGDILFDASYGGLPLHILRTEDDISRDVETHTYRHRDGGNTEDVGGVPRTTQCTILFQSFADGDELAIDAFNGFKSLVDFGEPQPFIHPLTGRYDALVSSFRFIGDALERDRIVVSATFIEHSTEVAMFEIGEGAPVAAGLEEVTRVAAAVDTELAAQGMTSSIGTTAIAEVTEWEDASNGLSMRAITLRANALANEIDREATRLELATDIDRYPLALAFQQLVYNVRRAAEVAIAVAPRLSTYTVRAAQPLLTIVQELYPAAEGLERFDEIVSRNDIANPALVPAGTVLTIEVP